MVSAGPGSRRVSYTRGLCAFTVNVSSWWGFCFHGGSLLGLWVVGATLLTYFPSSLLLTGTPRFHQWETLVHLNLLFHVDLVRSGLVALCGRGSRTYFSWGPAPEGLCWDSQQSCAHGPQAGSPGAAGGRGRAGPAPQSRGFNGQELCKSAAVTLEA